MEIESQKNFISKKFDPEKERLICEQILKDNKKDYNSKEPAQEITPHFSKLVSKIN